MAVEPLAELALDAVARPPVIEGLSKHVFGLDDDRYLVRMIPTLSSFTFDRHETVAGTEELRLDFYERAAARLEAGGVPTAFLSRVGRDLYVSRKCEVPPFEVIVKNAAYGSTVRKYPDLFPQGHRFAEPVVKFDYRASPEDIPIAEDYVRAYGCPADLFRELALETNRILREWLRPFDLIDLCIIVGRDPGHRWVVVSEISPDCMRLRDATGASLDKDLFRHGASHDEIRASWRRLLELLP